MSRFTTGRCAAPRHRSHGYADDGTEDHRGDSRCGVCGLPKSNRLHELPERDEVEKAAEARRMGES